MGKSKNNQISTTKPLCPGSENGSATVNITGGTPPYTYLWSSGATSQSVTLSPGTYTVTVTDAKEAEQLHEQLVSIANDVEQLEEEWVELSTTLEPN